MTNRTDTHGLAMMIETKLPRTKKRAEDLGIKFDATDAMLRARYSDELVDGWVIRGTNWLRTANGEVDSPFKSQNPGNVA